MKKIECIYRNLPGWASPTHAIRTIEALPKAAREYLAFIEKETGARVAMISTGPDREQTISGARIHKRARAKKLLRTRVRIKLSLWRRREIRIRALL